MAKGYIYKYTYPNGMIFFGETTTSVKQRHAQNMSMAKKGDKKTLFIRAIDYYGEPTVETIETIEVEDNEKDKLKDLLKEAKEKWIRKYDSTVESGRGFNIQGGGKMMSFERFLLTEKMNEIYEKEEWEESIAYVKELLKSIGTKICITKEKLTKEEQRIWFGYKFKEAESWYSTPGSPGKETTFSSFYNRYSDDLFDWGDFPDEVLDIQQNNDASDREKEWANQTQDKILFDITMEEAIEKHWREDIRQTIWEKVKKKNKDLVQLMEMQDVRKRIGIKNAQYKRYETNYRRMMERYEERKKQLDN